MSTCEHCGREMRPRGVTRDEAPGIVGTGSNGHCSTCTARLNDYGTLNGWMPGEPRGITDGPRAPTPIVDFLYDERPWVDDALCATTDPESYFPEKGGSTREAKATCLKCEVRMECLEWALEHQERFGIWGGLSERERRKLTKTTHHPLGATA